MKILNIHEIALIEIALEEYQMNTPKNIGVKYYGKTVNETVNDILRKMEKHTKLIAIF
jgi:hypothetical protein